MTEPHTDRDAAQASAGRPAKPIRYPTNHVVGVLDTPEQLTSAVTALIGTAFLDSEVEVSSGPAGADALHASTGRTGLANLAIRIAERLGVADEEMEMKDRYEQALRDGGFVVSVLAPSEERKDLAAQTLQDHGAHYINSLRRFAIESIHP